MKDINYDKLISNLRKVRKNALKVNTSDRFNHGYVVGFDTALNYVFALLYSKQDIICEQGEHPEDYIASLKHYLSDNQNDKL